MMGQIYVCVNMLTRRCRSMNTSAKHDARSKCRQTTYLTAPTQNSMSLRRIIRVKRYEDYSNLGSRNQLQVRLRRAAPSPHEYKRDIRGVDPRSQTQVVWVAHRARLDDHIVRRVFKIEA